MNENAQEVFEETAEENITQPAIQLENAPAKKAIMIRKKIAGQEDNWQTDDPKYMGVTFTGPKDRVVHTNIACCRADITKYTNGICDKCGRKCDGFVSADEAVKPLVVPNDRICDYTEGKAKILLINKEILNKVKNDYAILLPDGNGKTFRIAILFDDVNE